MGAGDDTRSSPTRRSGAHGQGHAPCRALLLGEQPRYCRFATRKGNGALPAGPPRPPCRDVPEGALMTKEPRVNLDRLVSQIVLELLAVAVVRLQRPPRGRADCDRHPAIARQRYRAAGPRLPGPALRRSAARNLT